MNTQSTRDPKLDDVLAFNEYLLKLSTAGVPIELELSAGDATLTEQLKEIDSRIAFGVARGNSVRQVLESDQQLPLQYRSALATWLFCDNSPEALDALSKCGEGRREVERLLGFSFVQPLILLGLVFIGFSFLTLSVAPKLESMNSQTGATPGFGLQMLMIAKRTIWYWGIAIPFLVSLTLVLWSRKKASSKLNWFLGRNGVFEAIQKANYATCFADLLEHGQSVVQTQTLLGSYRSDRSDQLVSAENTNAKIALPPMLQWALGDDVNSEDSANALRFSASGYRELAQSRTKQWRAWFPVVFGALLGGGLVLMFGLSLFAPMIELLIAITKPL
ncbi:MAG TPA: hypothetical protein VM260_27960 [Pirellula sp.]|nr:hypothetical protein [Pirellula sp.]